MKKIFNKNYEIIYGESILNVTIENVTLQALIVRYQNCTYLLQNRFGRTERDFKIYENSGNSTFDFRGYSHIYQTSFYPVQDLSKVFGFTRMETYGMVFNFVVGKEPIDFSDLTLPIYKEIKGDIVTEAISDVRGSSVSNIYKTVRLVYKNDSVIAETVSDITLCRGMSHPDCCGSYLYFNFEGNRTIENSIYRDLTDEDIKIIKLKLIGESGPAKLVHLSHKQEGAIAFVKKLGMELAYTYRNNNSGNTINVFHINPKRLENSES